MMMWHQKKIEWHDEWRDIQRFVEVLIAAGVSVKENGKALKEERFSATRRKT